MPRRALVLAALLLLLTPLCAHAADLVVWWQKGFYPQEDDGVREVVAAFEQKTGKRVELNLLPQDDIPGKIEAALHAGQPPDFAFDGLLQDYIGPWASQDRLVDLSDAIGGFANLFDRDTLAAVTWRNARTGQEAVYGLPFGREINHVHVWTDLLRQAGFTVGDIPREWEAFWSFWCDRVQPGLRRVLGRDDIWGVALPMSVTGDTFIQFFQFVAAERASYVTQDGRLVIDDPEIRRKLVKAMDGYTSIGRKGCTPPDAVTWNDYDNNASFLARAVVMTANPSLSIPNALKHKHPEDYYKNTVTIEWPLGPDGDPFPIVGSVDPAVVFKGGRNVALAKEFVRFLVADGWLAHYLDFTAERFMPAMSKLLEEPFWLDPSDPHQMASVMQITSRSLAREYAYDAISGNSGHELVNQENVWGKAVHRVVTEGVSPGQAVDEAIARIKQLLAQ
jgi:multiple sugar transport system substrate-binding protein